MCERKSIAVLLVCVGTLISLGLAANSANILRELDDYAIRYYAEPKPFQSAKLLKRYLQSEHFTDEESANLLFEERFSYFFAQVARMEPNIIPDYLDILEKGNHRQRVFMIDVLAIGGNDKVEEYFESKLRIGRFVNEAQQIRWYLQGGFPYDLGILEQGVNHPYDLEYLLAEFMASGNDKTILNIIDFMAEPNSLEAEPNIAAIYVEYWKKALGRYGKKDETILKICKEQLNESSEIRRGILEEIIDNIDGSISIARVVEQYRNEKPVTGAKAWALGASAVLIERNHGRHNFLSPDTITERNAKNQRRLLEEWWGIESTEGLLNDLEWLLTEGHRDDFEYQGRCMQVLSQQEYEHVLREYETDKEKQQEIRIARQYYEKLGTKSIIGWDLSRYICLCRWGFLCGYISEDEAWEKIMPVALILQKTFDSWEELGQNYLIGRQFWSYKHSENGKKIYPDAYQRLIDMKSSPWNLYPWEMELDEPSEISN